MLAIIRTSLLSLRRDRPALALSFLVPIAFFTIFAVIFGSRKDTMPRINVIVVDEDQSQASQALLKGLAAEGSLRVKLHPDATKKGEQSANYTAATAEAAVKGGEVSTALIIHKGFGVDPISFGPAKSGPAAVEMLSDSSDPIAPQMLAGLLQKTAFTALGPSMAEKGWQSFETYAGGFTPEQRVRVEASLKAMREHPNDPNAQAQTLAGPATAGGGGMMIAVDNRTITGETKDKPILSFYAAAVGVMFLLFTSTGAAGALLEEAESGTLDRVLSTRITMTRLLTGKLTYNLLLAFTQLTLMFLWAWLVFQVDLPHHLAGFVVMGLSTAFAVASFGILLASFCHTRSQLGSISTLLVLMMSSIGGSMFPRYLMPAAMQKAGLFTINAWAIDGFQKVFWYDQPVTELWPQVGVLLAIGIVLFVAARRFARRWEAV
jgi:ABC-2 type transport system permease protein